MHGPSGFHAVRSSPSRSPANRFLYEQRHQVGTGSWYRSRAIPVLSVLVLWLPGLLSSSQAQGSPPPTPMTSSGLHTQVNLSTTPPAGMVQYDITGGTRPGGGTNLFHSFGDFNVPNNNIANFLNDSGLATSNILGRVTGGNISNIYGTIQTTGFGNANLFLMNPAGFLFGPNATVNVGGMVAFTSADYLKLTDNARFNARPSATADALLTALPVASFGFLGSNPGAITVQGSQFRVTEGNGISLIGGNITIQSGTLNDGTVQPARLTAPGGQINFASVASPGEILAGTLAQAPNIKGQSFGALGAIQISQQSLIDVNGNGGGTVLIRGGQFVLDNSIISANITGPGSFTNGAESIGDGIDIVVSQDAVIQNGALIDNSVVGNATSGVPYGGVHIDADHIEVRGLLDFATGSTIIQSSVARGSTGGNAGSISLRANQVQLNDQASINSSTNGAGNAGAITIKAKESIALFDRSSITSDSGFGRYGNGGLVSLTAPSIEMHEGANIGTSTAGLGNAGNIELQGNQVHLTQSSIGARTQAEGRGGNITIRGLTGEGSRATDVRLSDTSELKSETVGDGEHIQGGAGNILVEAVRLHLSGGSLLNTASTGSTGAAGTITVNATDSLTISDSLLVSASQSFSLGDAGHISISAPSVVIENNGGISTSTSLVGNAGTIAVNTNSLQLLSGGHITSSSLEEFPGVPPSGPAGTVTIQGLAGPAQLILIDGSGSVISTKTEGTGPGGNITLNANTVTLQNGGTISAATSGTAASATGGTITVDATNTVTINSASITASSPGGADAGNINITAPNGFTMQNSTITTLAGQGASGGNIKVTTAPSATVLLQDSLISASVADGHGGGGNISIDPQFVILQNSQILAQAAQGQGGAITITAGLFLQDATSIVNADSGSGVNGTVTIQSPNAPISGQIQPLGKTPLIATSLLSQRCASFADGEFSSFTVAGRDSLPTEPGSWLASPLALGLTGTGNGTLLEKGVPAGIKDDPAHETTVLSLRQIAPAGFLTQAFAVDSSAGCTS